MGEHRLLVSWRFVGIPTRSGIWLSSLPNEDESRAWERLQKPWGKKTGAGCSGSKNGERSRASPKTGAEPLAPRRVRRGPVEFSPGFGIRRAADLCHHRSPVRAADQATERDGYMERWLRANYLGKLGKPDAHGRWFVIGNVVDPWSAQLYRRHRRRGSIVHMDKRPHPSPTTNDGQPAFAYRRHDISIGCQSRSRPIEIAVAKGDSFDASGTAHRLFQVADRLKRLLLIARRSWVERIFLSLEGGAGARIVPVAVALGNEPPNTHCLRRLQQGIGPFSSQAIGQRKFVVELLVILHPCEGGQLVDHDLWLGLLQSPGESVVVKCVGNHHLRACRAQWLDVLWRAGERDDLVAVCDQLRNQSFPDGATSASNKYFHGKLLLCVIRVFTIIQLPDHAIV